jgi:hypothetical protein
MPFSMRLLSICLRNRSGWQAISAALRFDLAVFEEERQAKV